MSCLGKQEVFVGFALLGLARNLTLVPEMGNILTPYAASTTHKNNSGQVNIPNQQTRMNPCNQESKQMVQMKPESSRPGAIVHPSEMDIILGRGVLHASHPGNIRFYAIIDKYLPIYEAAESRADKTKIIQVIYDTITSVGRFVKDDADSAACVVIETKKAKKKISHAIRFRRQAGKSLAAEARKTERDSPSPWKNSPGNGNVEEQESQPKVPVQQQDTLNGLLQENLAATRTKPISTSYDCIIPDEELESVLLLPPDEIELASRMHGNLLWGDFEEDHVSDTKSFTVIPPLAMRNSHYDNIGRNFVFQARGKGFPGPRPLPLPPRFVAGPPPVPLGNDEDPIPLAPHFPEDPLDLSKCFGDDGFPQSFYLGNDPLPFHPRFIHAARN